HPWQDVCRCPKPRRSEDSRHRTKDPLASGHEAGASTACLGLQVERSCQRMLVSRKPEQGRHAMNAALPPKRNVLQFVAAIPAVFVAVVSHFVACPACWPLVGGLISALGLTSLLETRLMLPLFVGCLLLGIAPLALQARCVLQPCILGLIASAFVLVGKFLLNATAVTV